MKMLRVAKQFQKATKGKKAFIWANGSDPILRAASAKTIVKRHNVRVVTE